MPGLESLTINSREIDLEPLVEDLRESRGRMQNSFRTLPGPSPNHGQLPQPLRSKDGEAESSSRQHLSPPSLPPSESPVHLSLVSPDMAEEEEVRASDVLLSSNKVKRDSLAAKLWDNEDLPSPWEVPPQEQPGPSPSVSILRPNEVKVNIPPAPVPQASNGTSLLQVLSPAAARESIDAALDGIIRTLEKMVRDGDDEAEGPGERDSTLVGRRDSDALNQGRGAEWAEAETSTPFITTKRPLWKHPRRRILNAYRVAQHDRKTKTAAAAAAATAARTRITLTDSQEEDIVDRVMRRLRRRLDAMEKRILSVRKRRKEVGRCKEGAT